MVAARSTVAVTISVLGPAICRQLAVQKMSMHPSGTTSSFAGPRSSLIHTRSTCRRNAAAGKLSRKIPATWASFGCTLPVSSDRFTLNAHDLMQHLGPHEDEQTPRGRFVQDDARSLARI